MLITKNKKITIISEFFYPDRLSSGYYVTKIAEYLAQKKYNVTVITKTFQNQKIKYSKKNINVIRVKNKFFDKNNLIQRLKGFFILSYLMCKKLLKSELNKNDTVVVFTNPALIIPFVSFFKIFYKFKIVSVVHDLFPENLVATKIVSKFNPGYLILKKIFDLSYSFSDTIIVCGNDMKKVMEKKTGKKNIIFVPNWYDPNIYLIPKKRNLNKNIFQFSGNIGRAQSIDRFVNIIKSIKSKNSLFHFYGKGAMLNFLLKNVNSSLVYKGSFNREQTSEILNKCDFGIVCIADTMYGLGVPSKTYNLLASGKPILFIGNQKSEISNIINENDLGFSCDFDSENIIKGVKYLSSLTEDEYNLMSKKCCIVAKKFFSENVCLDEYHKAITL